jgi:hypothetical protein
MYQKLFTATNLGNYQIAKTLGITYTQVLQYAKTQKTDINLFVFFGKKLGFTDVELSKMINDEIIKLYGSKG